MAPPDGPGAVPSVTLAKRWQSALALAALLILPSLSFTPLANAAHEPVFRSCVSPVGKDVVVVFDRSASMLDQGKLAAAKSAANVLLSQLSRTLDQSALVSFATTFRLDKGLDFSHSTAQSSTSSTQAEVNALVADGATSIGGAVRMARYELENGGPAPAWDAPYSGRARAKIPHVMVVLSDGDQTVHHANATVEANAAKNAGIAVYTVALGTDISPGGLWVMREMATAPGYAFVSPNTTSLDAIFRQISERLNDTRSPTLHEAVPIAALYDNNVFRGPSPVPDASAIIGRFQPSVIATDDCRIETVDWVLDVFEKGELLETQLLGSDHPGEVLDADHRLFETTLDCDTLPAGRHELRVTVTDWQDKSSSMTWPIVCVRAAVGARATAFDARLTNPAELRLATRGARLESATGGSDTFAATARSGATPLPHDLAVLFDTVSGSVTRAVPEPHPEHLAASALSRATNVTLGALGRFDVLEATASASVDADGERGVDPLGRGPLAVGTSSDGTTTRSPTAAGALAAERAAECTVGHTLTGQGLPATFERCADSVVVQGGLTVVRNERVTIRSLGTEEVTSVALRVLVDRPQARGEIIVGQAYAGASWLGSDALLGPRRVLDLQNDAGLGRDAPDTAATALDLAPGAYSGRVASLADADAYRVTALPGQKIRADLVPSRPVAVQSRSIPHAPATPAGAPAFAASAAASAAVASGDPPALVIELLDRDGTVRDRRATGAAAAWVELNADVPGPWFVIVTADQQVGEYTLTLAVEDAPSTGANDALLGEDAPSACARAALVGPGAHAGTLEVDDDADAYRFPAKEGQRIVLVLRPGDTADSATMSLALYDPSCRLLAAPLPVTSAVKGGPSLVLYAVPPGGSGLYRAIVGHVNGMGTYEIGIATSVAAVPV